VSLSATARRRQPLGEAQERVIRRRLLTELAATMLNVANLAYSLDALGDDGIEILSAADALRRLQGRLRLGEGG
jgi:hypothetical protein